jgi:phosphopantetheinyl transferase (holo-ACP synthase)
MKEAVMKARGGKLMKNFSALEIVHEKTGKPVLYVNKRRARSLHLSVSHEGDMVVAVAVTI